MAFTPYSGIFTGGFLTFMVVLFAILSVASIIWFLLYIEMSQRKTVKLTIVFLIITSLLIAFEIQLILLSAGVIF
ncbi:MAG: hypothetical protein ACXABK_05720 [Candidatus Heimdallarchaeaceae archaeon]|jgi:hypothetical protein